MQWLEGYETAWRTPGTATLAQLFDQDASYQQSPYEEPRRGLAEIAAMWEAEREGPDEPFTMQASIVAVDGDTAVARVNVDYSGPPALEYRDLWVMRFSSAGRCVAFEEWPFWPGQPRSAIAPQG
jgi:ketosteroid isomerase-like protein